MFECKMYTVINPWRACAARVIVLSLSVCVCECVWVCYLANSYAVNVNVQVQIRYESKANAVLKVSHLLAYEHSISQSEKIPEPALAKTMMTFIVRGLCTKLSFSYAQFPCRNAAGDLLYDPFWEAVGRLERCGFKVSSDNMMYSF